MGEEPTLAKIEKILAEYQDKAAEGFYVTGCLLEDKIVDKRGADLEYALDLLDTIKASIGTKKIKTRYETKKEKDGCHHRITIKAIGFGESAVHDIAIDYFVMDTEKEEKEKEELQELLDKNDPMVFENKRAKHGILDARIVDRYEIAGGLGAMFGYFISFGSRDYAQLMGVRFAEIAKKIFRKK